MVFAKPHFLLFCDASVSSCARSDTDPVGGRWHFVLERIDAASDWKRPMVSAAAQGALGSAGCGSRLGSY